MANREGADGASKKKEEALLRAVFEKAKVIVDGDDVFLCLAIPYREARKFCGEMKQKKYVAEIKEFREKRSLDANAYFWKMLDSMAEALNHNNEQDVTKEEIYLEYVRRCGPFKDFKLTEDEAKTFRVAWSRLGTGWPTEQVDYSPDGENVIIRAYYGSSQYNKKQMSRLIDMAVQDAKALGIETMTPAELERLKEEWG